MKVLMLKTTNFKGFREAGTEHEIEEDVAIRWTRNGIAKAVVEEATEEIIEDLEIEIEEVKVGYADMTAKALYALCVEKGIEVEQKKAKEYYIEALEGIETPEE